MQNVKMSVKGTTLILEIDLSQEGALSSTGKSFNVATTNGNQPIPGTPDLRVGVNVFRPNPDYVAPEDAKKSKKAA